MLMMFLQQNEKIGEKNEPENAMTQNTSFASRNGERAARLRRQIGRQAAGGGGVPVLPMYVVVEE